MNWVRWVACWFRGHDCLAHLNQHSEVYVFCKRCGWRISIAYKPSAREIVNRWWAAIAGKGERFQANVSNPPPPHESRTDKPAPDKDA